MPPANDNRIPTNPGHGGGASRRMASRAINTLRYAVPTPRRTPARAGGGTGRAHPVAIAIAVLLVAVIFGLSRRSSEKPEDGSDNRGAVTTTPITSEPAVQSPPTVRPPKRRSPSPSRESPGVREPEPTTRNIPIPASPKHVARDTSTVQPPKNGRLLVLTHPWCRVKVDGKYVGNAPMRTPVELSPGRHIIRLEPHSLPTVTREVNVLAGNILEVRWRLDRGSSG